VIKYGHRVVQLQDGLVLQDKIELKNKKGK
jgi:hypothetical protein